MKNTLVICSGGLDSISMALIKKESVATLMTFDYGQKAQREREVVKWLANRIGATLKEVDIHSLSWIFGKNQLTDINCKIEKDYEPSVVVPLRNGVFIEIAFAYAVAHGLTEIALGCHLDDCLSIRGNVAFPDCQPSFLVEMERANRLGSCSQITLVSAARLGMHKKDLIRQAYEIDKEALFKSWSCYSNFSNQCGVCDSCKNRRNAFLEAGIIDETIYGDK